jgi:DNA primase
VQLTTTQVSLIAALIALAAPAITYRANARLDRDRWVRERRAETYIEALAVLGRLAAYVAGPATWERYQTTADKDKDALETHRAKVRVLYAD